MDSWRFGNEFEWERRPNPPCDLGAFDLIWFMSCVSWFLLDSFSSSSYFLVCSLADFWRGSFPGRAAHGAFLCSPRRHPHRACSRLDGLERRGRPVTAPGRSCRARSSSARLACARAGGSSCRPSSSGARTCQARGACSMQLTAAARAAKVN